MKVTNHYDSSLQRITGRATEPAVISDNLSFAEYLYFILCSYPEIEKTYPPGILGFTVNGSIPTDFTVLKEGDNIYFKVAKPLVK